MSKMFRKFRGIPDKVIAGALQQHSSALAYALNRVNAYDRFRWVRRVWYVVITASVFELAHGDAARAYVEALLTR